MTPLKNVKKRLDARADAKASACTVTEALAGRIASKNWQEALQVFEMLEEQPFYMKLIVLLGRSGQPARAHQLFDEMLQQGCQPTPELYTALVGAYCRSAYSMHNSDPRSYKALKVPQYDSGQSELPSIFGKRGSFLNW